MINKIARVLRFDCEKLKTFELQIRHDRRQYLCLSNLNFWRQKINTIVY